MATYYVSVFGSDSNNGLGPDPTDVTNKPWRTIAKALGAAGIASGDTCYIGPGVYRESVTVAMTSAVAETIIAGDPYNAQGFCDGSGVRLPGGTVRWTGFTTNDIGAPPNTAALILAGRDFLTFRDMLIVGGGTANGNTIINATTTTSTNITFRRVSFFGIFGGIVITTVADTVLHWLFDACLFLGTSSNGSYLIVNAPTSAVADYDVDVVIKDGYVECYVSGQIFAMATSGANAFKAGGLITRGMSAFGTGALSDANNANFSTSIPCQLTNSTYFELGTAAFVRANTTGQITENWNLVFGGGGRSNTAVGANSRYGLDFWFPSGIDVTLAGGFQSVMFDGRKAQCAPWVGFGSDGNHPSTDLKGLPRPCGTMTFGDSGTATSGTTSTLTTSTKAWGTNQWQGWVIKITAGTGSGQVKQINSNTATALTVSGLWVTTPDNTSVYTIYLGVPSSSGKATAGAATSMTDSGAAWGTNQWTGFVLEIRAGTGSGQSTTVTSNTSTVLTVPTWGTNPDNTSQYWLYRKTSENTVNVAAGCFEAGNTWYAQTGTVRTGSTALGCMGPAVQDFDVPVNAAATTIKVWMRYDSTYAGTLPQMKVLFGDECGVSDATATMVGAASTWEQLSLTFTPARAGVVTIRLQSNSTVPISFAYADDFTQTPAPSVGSLGDYTRRADPFGALIGAGGAGGFFLQ